MFGNAKDKGQGKSDMIEFASLSVGRFFLYVVATLFCQRPHALRPAIVALLLACLFLLRLFALLARFLLGQLVRLVVEAESVA
jgi:hypothetical protein